MPHTNQVTLFSETDVNGTIVFANEAFCKVSKYTHAELIGKPHSIIRHPDMPSELFKHLWETIQRGEIFRGIIKNRAKDGTHYWVRATISPVRRSSKNITGYIAVRHLIPDDQVAELLYQEQGEI